MEGDIFGIRAAAELHSLVCPVSPDEGAELRLCDSEDLLANECCRDDRYIRAAEVYANVRKKEKKKHLSARLPPDLFTGNAC